MDGDEKKEVIQKQFTEMEKNAYAHIGDIIRRSTEMKMRQRIKQRNAERELVSLVQSDLIHFHE